MSDVSPVADSPVPQLYLLDMGREKYGDCILCRFGETTILVDGGHPGDDRSRHGYPSIPDQLEDLLGHPPPFDVSLLIVTHVHSDHIGCLPALVQRGDFRAEWALVADEKLGFGSIGEDSRIADAPPAFRRLLAALREESRADVKDDGELRRFLDDAEKLEDRYKAMLKAMKTAGTRVVRYGPDSHTALLHAFQHVGMKILGPTDAHLQTCADEIDRLTQDAIAMLSDYVTPDQPVDELAIYRGLAALAADSIDRPGKGAAINDQSIVLRFEVNGHRVLLTGDMQFAKPEVRDLNASMAALRNKVRGDGPYAFAKLAHHSSYNGVDRTVLNDLGNPPFLGHSGGRNDATHPDAGVLALLKSNRPNISWARTDRNGLITVSLASSGVTLRKSRGRLNDATPNVVDQPPEVATITAPGKGTTTVIRQRGASQGDEELVEVVARIPHVATRVTLTIDVAPRPQVPPSAEAERETAAGLKGDRPLPTLTIAAGRSLPKLLFVTSRVALRENMGSAEAEHVLAALRAAGLEVLDDLPGDLTKADQAAPVVRGRLAQSDYEGVVLLGGYDVIPAQRLDVLHAELRATLPTPHGDADDFIVWSDAIYGDRDDDGFAELPVARIPDGKSPELVFAAIQADAPARAGRRFGLRNDARPFADKVFQRLPGAERMLASQPTSPPHIPRRSVNAGAVYLMLHGADFDGSRFWGEDSTGTIEAFNITNIPPKCTGVVFTGCCWGALFVETTAAQATLGQKVAPMAPEASIALSFLKSGVQGFIGCTGTHYSPLQSPYEYYGGPMHNAFWRLQQQGLPPARALFEAKDEYRRGMPFAQRSPLGRAIGWKILRQFVCLGLGW